MKIIDLEQGTSEWLEFRRNKIGGSDAPAIMGVIPWTTASRLWMQKVTGKEQIINEYMQLGHEMEPILREQFIRHTGIEVKPAVAVHDEYHWMMASFDGIDVDSKTLLEIKTTSSLTTKSEIMGGKIPPHFMAQMQHQLAVSGYDKMYLMLAMQNYFTSDPLIVEIHRDDEYISRLIEKEKAFWNSLQTLEEPEDSDSFEIRHDNDFRDAELEFVKAKCALDVAQANLKAAREELIQLCEEENCKGISVEVRKIISRGRVKYDSIPQLECVDLNSYREPANESWRVEIVKT